MESLVETNDVTDKEENASWRRRAMKIIWFFQCEKRAFSLSYFRIPLSWLSLNRKMQSPEKISAKKIFQRDFQTLFDGTIRGGNFAH